MSVALRVWGRADQYDLTFEQAKSGDWRASVPADLADGQYAVELWAENALGEQVYWTGTLYMMDSRLICVRLTDEPYRMVLLPERVAAELMDDRHIAIVIRGCACAANV